MLFLVQSDPALNFRRIEALNDRLNNPWTVLGSMLLLALLVLWITGALNRKGSNDK